MVYTRVKGPGDATGENTLAPVIPQAAATACLRVSSVEVALGAVSSVARERVGRLEAFPAVREEHRVMATSEWVGRPRSRDFRGSVMAALANTVGWEDTVTARTSLITPG